jgi:hypothetical protein
MLCAGIVAAAVYNANPFRKAGAKMANPGDFAPERKRLREEPGEAQTEEQQIAILTAIFGCGPGKPAKNEGADRPPVN